MARENQKKRSRFETMYAILRLCSKGLKKTHIMYRANLSHQQLEKYLEILMGRDLLAIKEGNYVTTPRGMIFMQKYNELTGFMNQDNSRPQVYQPDE
jgi:predicted transcriptional regulator